MRLDLFPLHPPLNLSLEGRGQFIVGDFLSSSRFLFDHVSGVIRRGFGKPKVEDWDEDYSGFSIGLGVVDKSIVAFEPDDVSVAMEARRRMTEVTDFLVGRGLGQKRAGVNLRIFPVKWAPQDLSCMPHQHFNVSISRRNDGRSYWMRNYSAGVFLMKLKVEGLN